jgi:3-oxoadipate enol-lactonase
MILDRTSYVQVGDRSIAYETGDGRQANGGVTVVFVHGSSTDRRFWRRILPHLADRHRFVAFDNPGHGQSGLPALNDIDDGVDVTRGLISALGLGRVVLVGHSMGGAIVQRYLRRYPEDVMAVALASTAPCFALPGDLVERWLGDEVAYRREEAAMVTAPDCSDDIRARLLSMRDAITAEGQRSDLLTCAKWDDTEHYDEIAVPVLLITATADTALFRDAAVKWHRALSDRATLVEIHDAGHMMAVEQPSATGKALTDWLYTVAHGA